MGIEDIGIIHAARIPRQAIDLPYVHGGVVAVQLMLDVHQTTVICAFPPRALAGFV